jgi:hypothetical protein
MVMCAENLVRMFDWAEVLPGARDDFGQVRHQPASVATVETPDAVEMCYPLPHRT